MNVVDYIALSAGILHLAFLAGILYFWKKKTKVSPTPPLLRVSILVAFRNEEKSLDALCQSINALRYPSENFEVLFIDDHSDDRSCAIIRETLSSTIRMRILALPPDLQGKKNALAMGVEAAQSDWIACTDADCVLPPEWLNKLSQAQSATPKKMWCGRVYYHERSPWESLLAHEFTSVIATGGATIQAGFPTMCNGANLAYEKRAFHEAGGFHGNEAVASGDDEFLMHKLHRRDKGSVGFLNHREHTVLTLAPQSLSELFQQRIRWASKWQHYRNPSSPLLALFTFSLQGTLTLLPLFFLWGNDLLLGGILVVKVLSDSIFIHTIRKDFERPINLFILLCLEIFYPVYVLTIGVISRFTGYYWKGRRVA